MGTKEWICLSKGEFSVSFLRDLRNKRRGVEIGRHTFKVLCLPSLASPTFLHQAYLEFFVSPENLTALISKIESNPQITYHAVNSLGDMRTNTTSEAPNAVTWGVFPHCEIVQPTIVESISFVSIPFFELETSSLASVLTLSPPHLSSLAPPSWHGKTRLTRLVETGLESTNLNLNLESSWRRCSIPGSWSTWSTTTSSLPKESLRSS